MRVTKEKLFFMPMKDAFTYLSRKGSSLSRRNFTMLQITFHDFAKSPFGIICILGKQGILNRKPRAINTVENLAKHAEFEGLRLGETDETDFIKSIKDKSYEEQVEAIQGRFNNGKDFFLNDPESVSVLIKSFDENAVPENIDSKAIEKLQSFLALTYNRRAYTDVLPSVKNYKNGTQITFNMDS